MRTGPCPPTMYGCWSAISERAGGGGVGGRKDATAATPTGRAIAQHSAHGPALGTLPTTTPPAPGDGSRALRSDPDACSVSWAAGTRTWLGTRSSSWITGSASTANASSRPSRAHPLALEGARPSPASTFGTGAGKADVVRAHPDSVGSPTSRQPFDRGYRTVARARVPRTAGGHLDRRGIPDAGDRRGDRRGAEGGAACASRRLWRPQR